MLRQDRPDILLATINAKWIHPSLALRLLKANLGELEPHCRIIEFALRQPLKEKIDPLLEANPSILGISVSIWNHKATLELLKGLYEYWQTRNAEASPGFTKPLIVLGGPEVSWLPGDAEIFRYADYAIRGEGETAFKTLCLRIFEGMDPSNSSMKTEKSSRKAANLPEFIDSLPEDLSLIKTAYHLYSSEDLRRKLVYVEASRGCPFGCEFCLSAAGSEEARRVREFPLDEFLSTMDDLVKGGVKIFKFLDRTFNLDIKRATAIMEFFLDKLKNPQDDTPLCVHFEMVPSRFPDELKNLLCKFPAGSLRLEVGIQTLNPETSKLIGRPWDAEKELEVLRFLRTKTNAIVHADLIAGLPGEDLASFGEGFDRLWIALTGGQAWEETSPFSNTLSRVEIQLGILKLLPGAPIGRRTGAYGICYGTEPPYEVLETAALPASQLDRIKNFARFWEIIVNRNSFPDLAEKLFPPGAPVFSCFMELSDKLLTQFGKNWGIDRKELRRVLEG
ncbi:B12-binding domain-containing radical SAM protein [Leadbettera azotonutricia]|uniref:Radical SAM n=1 Tax=Leadbettera azotonutricia (strain ATCC BAA-888 / DSM 13862 / ZAS-9) TaxID=545695 RepID=F5Y9B1_LEAAZ|nr:radical SAM protein [Leadbettera azotonutricia]AEF80430.1 radical SAM [Leadbettera azotonutricia ZAS-9]